jgi:hypothetical protein
MRFQWRRLRPGELDAELIWLSVTVASAALGLVWLALQLPFPRCTFRAITSLPCVTCGATRAAIALAEGDLRAAFWLNPLVFIGMAAVAVFDVYALSVLVARAPRLRADFSSRQARPVLVGISCGALLLNWIYLLRQ